MELKKNPNADLEKSRGMFLLLGLILSLGIAIGAIEYRTYESGPMDLGQLDVAIDDEVIPITEREQKPPPPPPPPPPEILEVVADEVELEEELEIESIETDQEEVIEIIEVEEEESDEILNFAVVENKPVFPGCENEPNEEAKFQCFQLSLMKFISKNVDYPEMSRQMGVQGRVFVSFVVEKNGKISNVEVARGVDKMLDKSAVDVVGKLPKLKPAKQSGRAVRMSYTVPINFRLQ
jgi:protein TonB